MDIILYNIFVPIFCLLLGYFFGSFQTSIIVGKVFFHQDPRDYGSHNAGGTNAGRLWGKKVGFCIIVIDMIKTFAPVWICWALLTFINFPYLNSANHPLIATVGCDELLGSWYAIQYPVYWLSALGCLVGHCWPIFTNFKGGKGVSCFMGTTVGTSWGLGFIPGLSYFAFLKWKKYVSLTSILTGIVGSIVAWIWAILLLTKVIPIEWSWIVMYGQTLNPNWMYATVVTLMAIIMIIRHNENIHRLKAGNERKIKWMK
ncbi:MAG: glycerol-3-phosphate 1-O-acyltransferase PlsY [Bacilli bacterium]|nr:glycerol-3-phosphate 1-O-acyltransferase PlsY [Bacilli bacterium]